jgi:hypothetical protein
MDVLSLQVNQKPLEVLGPAGPPGPEPGAAPGPGWTVSVFIGAVPKYWSRRLA